MNSDSNPAAAVQELIVEMSPLGVAEVTPETALVEELGFDSLGLVELLVVIEDRLDLPPLEEQALIEIERVGDLERIATEALGPDTAQARTG
jgi:acyl carrier protein